MSIKVKHEGNATPGAFAAAAGGQGKRAQQDAAQMSQVMQNAANAGNQQLRGATAPGASPGHTTAQLVHAPAPSAGNAGMSGTRGGDSSGGMDPYEQRKLLEQKYGYEKELKKMGIDGDLAKISRQASENRGSTTWAARTEQAQHPDVPEQPNVGVQAPGQEGQGLSPLKPLNPNGITTQINPPNQAPVAQETVKAVNGAFTPMFLLNHPMGENVTTLGEVIQPSSFQQRLKQIVSSSVNKLNRGINPSESDKNDDLLSKLVSQLSGQSVGRQKSDDNSVVITNKGDFGGADMEGSWGTSTGARRKNGTRTFLGGNMYEEMTDNDGNTIYTLIPEKDTPTPSNATRRYVKDADGVMRPYDNQSADAGNRVSAYMQDSDYGFMDKIFSIV